MPAHRKSTTKLKLIGAIERNKRLDRPDDVVTGAFEPEAPKHLSAEAKVCWDDLLTTMPYGIWQRTDRFLVEITATLLAEHRADPVAFGATRLGQLRLCLSSLGLSPVDRARLPQPPAKYNPSSLLD